MVDGDVLFTVMSIIFRDVYDIVYVYVLSIIITPYIIYRLVRHILKKN